MWPLFPSNNYPCCCSRWWFRHWRRLFCFSFWAGVHGVFWLYIFVTRQRWGSWGDFIRKCSNFVLRSTRVVKLISPIGERFGNWQKCKFPKRSPIGRGETVFRRKSGVFMSVGKRKGDIRLKWKQGKIWLLHAEVFAVERKMAMWGYFVESLRQLIPTFQLVKLLQH